MQYVPSHLLNWTFELEPDWGQISVLMRDHGSKESWTAERVKYAWHFGVSALIPEVTLLCMQSSGLISC